MPVLLMFTGRTGRIEHINISPTFKLAKTINHSKDKSTYCDTLKYLFCPIQLRVLQPARATSVYIRLGNNSQAF